MERNGAKLGKEIQRIPLEDVAMLLKYARRLRRLQSEGKDAHCKIAVLGSCSIQYLARILEILLYRDGISTEIYEGKYDGIRLDILDENSEFYIFQPDITIILTDYRDIREFPQLFDTDKQVEDCVRHIAEEHRLMWETIHRRLPGCQIIMSTYVVPIERVLGNMECNYTFSRQNVYRKLNGNLADMRPPYVLLADIDYLASAYGKLNWFDPSAYMLSKIPFALKYTGYAADLFAKLVGACRGRIKKCLILDLDNTLWGGVVSEEGPGGIRVGQGDVVGEAFMAFQEYLKLLESRGVILAVCSKNDEHVAQEPFTENSGMVLKLDDFAAFYANWDDKATNIRAIAGEIGIGLDSIVFFDDSPAERNLVETQLPEVAVIDVPEEPADYVRTMEMSGCFEWAALTSEDLGRAASYTADRKRGELQEVAADYDSYLKQLHMHGCVQEADSRMLHRFSQLVNKSNQFNLRTRRYTEAELSEMMGRDDCRLLAGSLTDKFSSYGIISCVILKRSGEQCFIDTWVMSCRVLKRGVEYLVFRNILEAAREWGCMGLDGEYVPTEKNGMVRTLLPELGFLPDPESSSRYHYDLMKEFQKEYYIEEEDE